MLITRISKVSGVKRTKEIKINQDQYDTYQHGADLEECAPHLSTEDKEFIKSGMTNDENEQLILLQAEDLPGEEERSELAAKRKIKSLDSEKNYDDAISSLKQLDTTAKSRGMIKNKKDFGDYMMQIFLWGGIAWIIISSILYILGHIHSSE